MKIPVVGLLFSIGALGLWAGRDYYNTGSYTLGKFLYLIAAIAFVSGIMIARKEYKSRKDPLGIDDID